MGEYVCNEIEKSLFETKTCSTVVFNKDKLTHSKLLFKNLNALNVYQINIYQHLKTSCINLSIIKSHQYSVIS